MTDPVIPDPPDVSSHPNLTLLNDRICGKSTYTRIVNGMNTSVVEFPWMALIAYDVGRPNPEFRCGGTIITSRYILTAAHCVTTLPAGKGVKLDGQVIRVGSFIPRDRTPFVVLLFRSQSDRRQSRGPRHKQRTRLRRGQNGIRSPVHREIPGLWCGEHPLPSSVHEEQAAKRHSAHQGEQRYRLPAAECQANLSAGGCCSGSDLEKGKSTRSFQFPISNSQGSRFFKKL